MQELGRHRSLSGALEIPPGAVLEKKTDGSLATIYEIGQEQILEENDDRNWFKQSFLELNLRYRAVPGNLGYSNGALRSYSKSAMFCVQLITTITTLNGARPKILVKRSQERKCKKLTNLAEFY